MGWGGGVKRLTPEIEHTVVYITMRMGRAQPSIVMLMIPPMIPGNWMTTKSPFPFFGAALATPASHSTPNPLASLTPFLPLLSPGSWTTPSSATPLTAPMCACTTTRTGGAATVGAAAATVSADAALQHAQHSCGACWVSAAPG